MRALCIRDFGVTPFERGRRRRQARRPGQIVAGRWHAVRLVQGWRGFHAFCGSCREAIGLALWSAIARARSSADGHQLNHMPILTNDTAGDLTTDVSIQSIVHHGAGLDSANVPAELDAIGDSGVG
jgi:hypothetical protein